MAGRSSRRGGNTSNSNGRIQALVEQKLAEGLQYEALQLYRGVVSRKSARGDDATAISIAEQGIGVLLREGYADSATELGNVLISILSDHELPPTDERVGTIVRLNSKYEDAKRAAVLAEEDRLVAQREKEGSTGDRDEVEKDQEEEDSRSAARGTPSVGALQAAPTLGLNDMSCATFVDGLVQPTLHVRIMNGVTCVNILETAFCDESRSFPAVAAPTKGPKGRFLKLAVAWTAARGRRLSGDPRLCALLGRCLWAEGDLERGMRYLVLGERPQELCDLIMQDVPSGKSRELVVAKGVLRFASKASLRDANALLEAYKNKTQGKPKGLLLFCGLLLKTCEYDATPVFQKLLESYRADLSVDEDLFRIVESIAMTYFNLRLRPPSMLDNIMGMIGGM